MGRDYVLSCPVQGRWDRDRNEEMSSLYRILTLSLSARLRIATGSASRLSEPLKRVHRERRARRVDNLHVFERFPLAVALVVYNEIARRFAGYVAEGENPHGLRLIAACVDNPVERGVEQADVRGIDAGHVALSLSLLSLSFVITHCEPSLSRPISPPFLFSVAKKADYYNTNRSARGFCK